MILNCMILYLNIILICILIDTNLLILIICVISRNLNSIIINHLHLVNKISNLMIHNKTYNNLATVILLYRRYYVL